MTKIVNPNTTASSNSDEKPSFLDTAAGCFVWFMGWSIFFGRDWVIGTMLIVFATFALLKIHWWDQRKENDG